jgi:tRNA 2-thiouridine synthesizing protein C
MTPAKKILLISRKPPYGNALSREAIDIALAATAFDQDISLLFSGDGVWQLLKQQQSHLINNKNHGKALSALTLYGIENIYVDTEALALRNLTENDLLIETKSITTNEIKKLCSDCDTIFNF